MKFPVEFETVVPKSIARSLLWLLPLRQKVKVMPLLKLIIQNIANRFGLKITRIQRSNDLPKVLSEHQAVCPIATYSPWNKDDLFQAAFSSIKDFTLVDIYRCFELWKLVEQVAKLPSGSLIEIGAWRGGTGALIARQAQNYGIQETVFLCDTFTGVVKAGESDSTYKNGEHADTSRQTVEDLIFNRMALENVEILEGIFPDQTGNRVENLEFRFCHIDVDVYQSAKDIVNWIWSKMVPGGIIIFDDYGFYACSGITKYVEEQMMYGDRLIIHNLNGHAIVLKL